MQDALNPETIQGLITLVTLLTALVAGVAVAVTKIVNVTKEAIIELRGIRTEQRAADVVKVAQGQASLAAIAGAEPINSARLREAGTDGNVLVAAVSLLSAATPTIAATGVELPLAPPATVNELKTSIDALTSALDRMAPPLPEGTRLP